MRFALWLLADPATGTGVFRPPVERRRRESRLSRKQLRRRRRLAASIRRVLETPTTRRGAGHRVLPSEHVGAVRTELERLARRLGSGAPVDSHGLALTRALITDGTGPLYRAASPEELGARVREALGALEPGDRNHQVARGEGACRRRAPRRRWVTRTAIATILGISTVAAFGLVLTARADAYVYWVNAGADAMGRANRDGLGLNLSMITGMAMPRGMAVDGEHVYWVNARTQAIGRADLDGSNANQRWLENVGAGYGVAVDGEHIYWARRNHSSIGRANLDGSDLRPAFVNPAGEVQGVAVNDTHVYWTSEFTNTIGRAKIDGTERNVQFITGISNPRGLAVDGEHIYWANLGTNSIGRANLDGSDPDDQFIAGASSPLDVAADERFLYWSEAGRHTLGRANLDGSAPSHTYIAGLSHPVGVAVDSGEPGRATASTTELDFGSVPLNTTAPLQTVTVTNEGQGELHVGQPEITDEGGDFVIGEDHCSQVALAYGESCFVALAFRPTTASPRFGTLRIPSDGVDGALQVALSGAGVAPPASEAPATEITRAPKRRTRTARRRARVSFEFTAGPRASAYECRLDGAAWSGCNSPYSRRVRRGRHTFAVRALDAGGRVGPQTEHTFKVVRRR